ncbi:MAG: glycosyl hydrolase [Lachnospiraceae bacterium]|nr:glycosyl hydrolase [Lachnospiraceae bacterium]
MRKILAGILISALCAAVLFGCGKNKPGQNPVPDPQNSSQSATVPDEKEPEKKDPEPDKKEPDVKEPDEKDPDEKEPDEKEPDEKEPDVKDPVKPAGSDVAVWYPYWDYDTATQELQLIGRSLNTVCLFAAYYDVSNKAFIPEETINTYNELKAAGLLNGRKTYLTFVNDKLLNSGSSLKDTDLLYALIGDKKKASAHIDEVVTLCRSLNCDGIEIDYEAIKKDKKLWGHFVDFITLLSERCTAENLSLRIVLEPSAPLTEYSWPANAEYVMMCYNLYGYGTVPGAKAETEWIKSLCAQMKNMPGTPNMAFATGGFDFYSNGNVDQIDYKEAVLRMNSHGAVPNRDAASGDMYYTYTDDSGMSHEVWYADQETLKLWIGTAKNCGVNRVSIWRFGGNIL